MSAWEVLLAMCSGCFTAPSFGLFAELISAWVCCPTRRTVCAMIATMDLDQACAHDAYHRFLRAGAWSLGALFEVLARALVAAVCPAGILATSTTRCIERPAPRWRGQETSGTRSPPRRGR